MYRPLPFYLTIKESPIDGLGLFAKQRISSGTDLGITHVKNNRFEMGYIRTPLGGFFNHSKNPNCKVIEVKEEGQEFPDLHLFTTRDIEEGEELTAYYTLYQPS